MEARDTSLQIDGRNRHICAFFNDMDEHYRVLQSFIKDGFDHGDRAFHLINPERREEHLARLVDAGIDVELAMAAGQLEVRAWQDTCLRGDQFDRDAMLALVEELLNPGAATAFPRSRLLGHMEWSLLEIPGVDDLLEYEARLNQVIPDTSTVICAYDLSKFDASTVIYALRTHPVVIIGGLLQENPFYVDPDQLLLELREQQSRVGAGVHH